MSTEAPARQREPREAKPPLPMPRIEDLYAWSTAWDAGPKTADMVALQERNRTEFRRAVALYDQGVKAAAWNEAIAHVCETLGIPNVDWKNPFAPETESVDPT